MWSEDEIIMRASPEALEAIRASTLLLPFAYHVDSLDGDEGSSASHGGASRPRDVQQLPEGGLLFIRPVRTHHSWHQAGEPHVDWNDLPWDEAAEARLDDEAIEQFRKYFPEEIEPPRHFRMALATLSRQLQQPVLYYSVFLHGGTVEFEYTLAYGPGESLAFTTPFAQDEIPGIEDSLSVGLETIGVMVPSKYFLPHTRSFPWHLYKLEAMPDPLLGAGARSRTLQRESSSPARTAVGRGMFQALTALLRRMRGGHS